MARKATWEMSAEELARTVAAEKGWRGDSGGWIYAEDLALAHGYGKLSKALTALGAIATGRGIDWRRLHGLDLRQLARAARRA